MSHRNLRCELAIDGFEPATFHLAEFRAVESLFDAYRLAVDAISREHVDAQSLLGRRGALLIHLDENTTRRLHGVVLRAAVNAVREEIFRLSIEIGARLELLKLGQSSRMFQEISVVDVVKQVLDEAGLTGDAQAWGETKTTSYPKREYIAQHNESDFDFIRRLLSEEGIGFAINNSDQQDQIVFFDNSTSLPAMIGDPVLPDRGSTQLKEDTVIELAESYAGASDEVMLRDYDFKRPSFDVSCKEKEAKSSSREVYLHPGNFVEMGVGKRLAKRALERLRCGTRIVRGTTDCSRLEPGKTFKVESHPRAALNAEYLVLTLSHRGSTAPDGEENVVAYFNEFTAIPKAVPYRPPEIAPPIRVVEVAFVTFPPGEEIHADDFGRVKVRFPWDRSGTKDDKSSCWLRVGQVALGGSMVLPRGDFEVTVDFELGDLDRPFVSGHLYNAEKAPPYALPGGKTRSSVQSATTAGGPGANELRFEDAAGKEEIFFNASKDLTVSVENDGSTHVTNNEKNKVGANRELSVGADRVGVVVSNRSLTVGASQTVNVGKNLSDAVGGSEKIAVGGMRKVQVTGDHNENCVGSLSRSVGLLQAVTTIRGYQRKVVGASSTQVGAAWLELVAKNRSSMVVGTRRETVGAIKLVKAKQLVSSVTGASIVNAAAELVDCKGRSDSAEGPLALTAGGGLSVKATNINIEAEDSLVLIAGACSIKLSSDGTVEITAPNVDLEGAKSLSQVMHKSN